VQVTLRFVDDIFHISEHFCCHVYFIFTFMRYFTFTQYTVTDCAECIQMPFMHESLLLDQKDQRLTRSEKRLAQQGYEREKLLGSRPSGRSHSPPRPINRRPYSPAPPPTLDLPLRHGTSDRYCPLCMVRNLDINGKNGKGEN